LSLLVQWGGHRCAVPYDVVVSVDISVLCCSCYCPWRWRWRWGIVVVNVRFQLLCGGQSGAWRGASRVFEFTLHPTAVVKSGELKKCRERSLTMAVEFRILRMHLSERCVWCVLFIERGFSYKAIRLENDDLRR